MTSIMKNRLDDLLAELRVAVAFLTRIPMPHPDGAMPHDFARAQRMFPVVGAAIGAATGFFYLAALAIGLPALAAAAIAIGAGALLTGALHEDGLADVADGFGGGRDKATKLEIMRDSRLGTYGALILLVIFFAKLAALAALPAGLALPGLIAAHALARGVLPVMATRMPYARTDGLAANAGRPDARTAATAAALAIAIAFLALPWTIALGTILAVAAGAAAIAMLAQRQIGGQTGDVLGAAEQVGETAVLLLLCAAQTSRGT
jgi:adenosylcobinamide-GDP ribazoletransferase